MPVGQSATPLSSRFRNARSICWGVRSEQRGLGTIRVGMGVGIGGMAIPLLGTELSLDHQFRQRKRKTAPLPAYEERRRPERSHSRATLPPMKPAVPSPKRGLTSVFGMGTGVAPALWRVGKPNAPTRLDNRTAIQSRQNLSRVVGASLEHHVDCVPWTHGQASRAISTGQLHALLRFHLRPITS